MPQKPRHQGHYVRGRKGLNVWAPLLEEWVKCVANYCKFYKGEDAPYWYTERANTSILAGAAWRCGMLALEEFQREKGYRTRDKWNGRVDLCIATGDKEFLFEAKHAWLSLSLSPERMQEKIESILSKACDDTLHTRGNDKSVESCGIAFLPTYIATGKADDLDAGIASAIAALKMADCHAAAWCFPPECRRLDCGNDKYAPGVLLALSNTRHS